MIDLQTRNPECAKWQKQELNGKRLVGFRVVETDYPGTLNIVDRNIRQIQPIVDCLELLPPNGLIGGGLGLPNEAGGVTAQFSLDRSE